MKPPKLILTLLLSFSLAIAQEKPGAAQYGAWKQAGALALLTTPEQNRR